MFPSEELPVQAEENYTESPAAPVQLSVPADCAGLRLDQTLAKLMPKHSRARLTGWIRNGQVTVDGHTVAPRHAIHGGEVICVLPSQTPEETAFRPESIPLDVLHEDDTLLVINKPPGLVVHPGSGNWEGTLLNALLAHDPLLKTLPRAGIVHRLDKDTSGLLVVAKTLTAQTDLVRQLQARSVQREYCAVVHGTVKRDGTVDAPIGRDPRARTRMAVIPSGKPAVTHYRITDTTVRASVLECRLETGRTHQIRVHLKSIGHPIWGDPVYGPTLKRVEPVFPRQALHAQRLSLIHPVSGETMTWQAPLPEDMRTLIRQLKHS
jgi:23S rRNA pseudouridine1911/1915/1917 synthase